ncbi:hypothetical protein C8039_01945 [Halogeometricum sp. wsp3]|nr:hypothetical protein C8039_01945 [Halogeometricum sp. wsp3]
MPCASAGRYAVASAANRSVSANHASGAPAAPSGAASDATVSAAARNEAAGRIGVPRSSPNTPARTKSVVHRARTQTRTASGRL